MTSSQVVELLGVQMPQIVHLPPHVHSLDAGLEAIELAESVGVVLDEAQRFKVVNAMAERVDMTWCADTVGDFEARQNGKGETMIVRQLWGLFVGEEALQIATAHEFPTANEAFLRLVSVIEGSDDLRRQVARIRYANGEQGVELLNGCRLKYRARTSGSGRGFAGVDTIYYDEAMYLTDAHIAASGPAGITKGTRRQIWYASSAGLATSSVLWRLRKRALGGNGGRFAYVEHTAEQVRLDATGRVVSVRPDPDDRHAWAMANPTLGDRIGEEAVSDERNSYDPDVFLRERLSVWDPELGTGASVWPDDVWHRCSSDEAAPSGRMYVGVAATPDRKRATIAVAGGGVVEVALNASLQRVPASFGDLAADVIRIARELDAMVFVAPDGPAGFIIPELEASYVPVTKVSPQAMGQACGQIYTAVNEGRFRVRRNPDLNAAVAGAVQRDKGDVWVWARRDVAVDVSPLEAVTLAWWGDVQASQFFGGSVASLSDFDT